LALTTNPIATDHHQGKKRKRDVSDNKADSSIRVSARSTPDSHTPTMANDTDVQPPKKRARQRPTPNSDAVLERTALNYILYLVGLQNVVIPQTGPLENKPRRLREYEAIAERVFNLTLERREHWEARVNLERELDDTKENVEELELSVAVRDDLEDLLEAKDERLEELEKEKKALEEEIAKLCEAAKA
jgi:hypothetical protein